MRLNTMLRWIAHIWGMASFLVILAFAFGGAESMRPTANEALGLLFFPVGVVVGFGIAGWRERLGGLVTVGSLALFYVWMYCRDGRIAAGPYFILFAAPGFLHLVNSLASGTRTDAKQPSASSL